MAPFLSSSRSAARRAAIALMSLRAVCGDVRAKLRPLPRTAAYAGPPTSTSSACRSRATASINGGGRSGGRSAIRVARKRPHVDLAFGISRGGAFAPRADRFASPSSTALSRGDVGERGDSKYHLVWSRNFWKKMMMSSILIYAVQAALKGGSGIERELFPHACHGQERLAFGGLRRVFPTAVVLPLLSSSCCAVQLIINALSGWGCVGFNTYLGPIRPLLLPLLLFSVWRSMPHVPLGWTVFSLFLAFLPELVDIWNTNQLQRWQRDLVNGDKSVGSIPSSPSPLITAKLRLDIPTMGCVACVNKVDASIRQCKSAPNIKNEVSWLTEGAAKGGMAELLITAGTDHGINEIVKEVATAVKDAGFQCDVKSLEKIHLA